MKKKTLRGLLVKPGEAPVPFEIEHTLENMYQLLGCEIIDICYPFDDCVALVCDDEGKINHAKPNRIIWQTEEEEHEVTYSQLRHILREADRNETPVIARIEVSEPVPYTYDVTEQNVRGVEESIRGAGQVVSRCYTVTRKRKIADIIAGAFLLCLANPLSEDLEDLPDELMKEYAEKFSHIDQIVRVGDHLCILA